MGNSGIVVHGSLLLYKREWPPGISGNFLYGAAAAINPHASPGPQEVTNLG